MKEITANTDLDIEKEFRIEAGPGAGKTRFLIHHINNVIKESHRLYSARKVACITFTNTAVDTIRLFGIKNWLLKIKSWLLTF